MQTQKYAIIIRRLLSSYNSWAIIWLQQAFHAQAAYTSMLHIVTFFQSVPCSNQ